jgi:hypothetical protein
MTPSKRLIDGVTYNTETATLLALKATGTILRGSFIRLAGAAAREFVYNGQSEVLSNPFENRITGLPSPGGLHWHGLDPKSFDSVVRNGKR